MPQLLALKKNKKLLKKLQLTLKKPESKKKKQILLYKGIWDKELISFLSQQPLK